MTIINELDSTCGISDEELTVRFRESIRIDNEIRKIKGLPIAGYDDKTKRAYLEYPDGRREYVGEYINADDIKRATLCTDLVAADKRSRENTCYSPKL